MELHNNRVVDFCKRIKSQQSDPAKEIPFCRHEIQFYKKKRRNETMRQISAGSSQKIQFYHRLGSF